jgi:hypothetical protein
MTLAAVRAAAQGTAKGRFPTLLPRPGQQGNNQGMINADPPKPVDPRVALKERQDEIREQVEKLYELAGQLKSEAEKADAAHVLSLPILKKAEQIQKIAKHIESLARG